MVVKITCTTYIRWESLFELFKLGTKWNTDTDDAWINSPCFSLGKNSPNWEEKLLKFKAWLWTLWKNKMNTENDHHRLIDFFLKFNVEVDTILNDFHPRYGFLAVPLQEATQLYSRGMQMAQIHCQLMTFYKGQGIKLFNLTSKTHFVLHSLFNARWLHPSLVWCYKDEDQMQRVARLWKSCLDGSKHWQTAKRAVWKERHLLFLRNKVGWGKKASVCRVLFYLCKIYDYYFTSFITCVTFLHISYLCSATCGCY